MQARGPSLCLSYNTAFVEGRGFQENGNLAHSGCNTQRELITFVISIDQNAPSATMTVGTLTNVLFSPIYLESLPQVFACSAKILCSRLILAHSYQNMK